MDGLGALDADVALSGGALGVAAFRALVERSRDLLAVADRAGRYVYASPSHAEVLGWTPGELLGQDGGSLIHPDDAVRVAAVLAGQIASGSEPPPVKLRFRHRDGGWVWLELVATNLLDDPAVRGIVVSGRDMTYRYRADELAADQARILEHVARGAELAVVLGEVAEMVERWLPDATGVVVVREGSRLEVAAAPNLPVKCVAVLEKLEVGTLEDGRRDPRFCVMPTQDLRQYGYETSWSAAIGDGDLGTLGAVIAYRRAPGEPTLADRQLLELAGNVAGICMERGRAERRLRDLALCDPLTGLANRAVVTGRIRGLIETFRSVGSIAAVLFLDLDRFKVLNDSLGHSAGDRLLVELGPRLERALRATDMVARFGGDEFVVVLEQVADLDEAHRIAERILSLVEEPFVIDGRDVVVTTSIGIAIVAETSPEALLRDADTAMYRAKERGGGRVELFGDTLRAAATQRLDTERDLRQALSNDEFLLHYQPAFLIATGQLIGFEALLRWAHPTRGLLGPDSILPVAEEVGLMSRIGMWALRTALSQARAWQTTCPEWSPVVMGVNVSARQLADPGFVSDAAAVIDAVGIDPGLVVLELSESAVLTEANRAQAVLTDLRELGVHLALDDFGIGYSSIMHLKRFPIETIKLDQGFIAGLTRNRQDDAIVASLTSLADTLGLFVVAEGVETAAQARRLVELGCHMGQGHYWARALPASEVPARLAASRRTP